MSTMHEDDQRRRRRGALVVPAVGLVFATVVLAHAHMSAPDLGPAVLAGFWVWVAVPFALTGALGWWAASRTSAGWRLTTGLGIALLLAGIGGYVSARLSETASLIILSGPLVQDAAVVAVGVVELALARRAGSRHDRDAPSPAHAGR